MAGTWFNGETYDALTLRQVLTGALLTHDKHPVTAREGVFSGMNLTTAGTGAYLFPGIVAVSPQPDGGRGTYMLGFEGANLAFSTPDSSSRIDAVVAKVSDDEFDGSGKRELTIQVIKGIPGANPVGPPTPTGSLLLWHVRVAGGSGTTSATDKRVWTASSGGVLAGHSNERHSLPTEHLRPSQNWTDLDSGIRRVWFNNRWTADQVVGWRGCVGLGTTGTLSIPPMSNFAPDINEVSGGLGAAFNSMYVQRLSRKLKPSDGLGRYDVVWNVSVAKAAAPGELWAGICVNNNEDPPTNAFGDITGMIVAETHAPLSQSEGGFRGAPGSVVQVTAQGLRLDDSSTILLYVWHDSTEPVEMYFNAVRTYATISRIGF